MSGVLVATDDEGRAHRNRRLGLIESTFDPLPIDSDVAREWGRPSAAVSRSGGKPRRRAIDLAIAATTSAHRIPLLTHSARDFRAIDDHLEVRAP